MNPYSLATVLAGAAASIAIAFASTAQNGPRLIEQLERNAAQARDVAGGNGIDISFMTAEGWHTRHARLRGGQNLDQDTRARTAAAIAEVPGIGGVVWRSRSGAGGDTESAPVEAPSVHCQDDVEAILKTRSIRFTEGSARIDRASQRLLNEVATALMPCVGSIIAITGYTDSNGDESANLALSHARADAVRWALIGRGIPADGLRATGVGSRQPVTGLDPTDPANRRIEFSVIESMPLKPTPIDTPGPE